MDNSYLRRLMANAVDKALHVILDEDDRLVRAAHYRTELLYNLWQLRHAGVTRMDARVETVTPNLSNLQVFAFWKEGDAEGVARHVAGWHLETARQIATLLNTIDLPDVPPVTEYSLQAMVTTVNEIAAPMDRGGEMDATFAATGYNALCDTLKGAHRFHMPIALRLSSDGDGLVRIEFRCKRFVEYLGYRTATNARGICSLMVEAARDAGAPVPQIEDIRYDRTPAVWQGAS